MKKVVSGICAALLCLSLSAQKIEPIKANIGKLNISIDPRLELLGAVHVTADYPMATNDTPYSEVVKEYFKNMKDSKAVQMTKSLLKDHSFSYDAPATIMLYMSQPYGLKRVLPWTEYHKKRAGGAANLEKYRKALADFAKESNFEQFWNSQKDRYDKSLKLTLEQLKDIDYIQTIEKYYNGSKNSYNVIICPLLAENNYGPTIDRGNGKSDIYSLTCTVDEDDASYLYRESSIYIIFHEFGHSFVNPVTAKYPNEVKMSEKLLEPIKSEMADLAYSDWWIVLNEHIVRATVVREMLGLYGADQAEALTRFEEKYGFIYIRPIMEELKKYETLRDTQGMTFADYMPRLLSALANLEK